MMRSLYAGVSGLQTHQVKMDVISNNISNINTVGFKSGRVTFQESLTQVISSATRPQENRGGLNPEQIGLGSAISSIGTNFTQGNLETTGNVTDLAIDGDAFFILNGGGQDYYTRAGNFVVDGDGHLTSPQNGFILQGKLADSDGVIQSGAKIEDIVLPFGQKAPANQTTEIQYVCNLDSDTEALEQIWSANLGTGVAGTDDLNTLSDIVSTAITAGDQIIISGTNPDGSAVNATFTYGAGVGQDGTTVDDLITVINGAFTNVTASLSNDQLILTDTNSGESGTTASFSFLDVDLDGSEAVFPSFVNEQTGRDPGEHTASITVYDSKGGAHTVSLNMTNASTPGSPNVWTWSAEVDDGDITPSAGNTGTIRFNTDGSLAAFTIDDGQPLTFNPGNGSELMQIDLNGGESGSFAGITQLESPTTTVAKYQDGYGMGNLQTVSIDSDGTIIGHFSNGVSQILAQVALAQFNNPSGLVREGDNMYSATANSGTAVKGVIDGGIQGSISSGSLEMSNVDLAQEFTDMIVAQRGFQANSRVITTADTLLQEIVQLKR